MPTIVSINLKDNLNQPLQTEVSFTLVGQFTSESSSVVVGTKKSISTNASGIATVNLSVGKYVVNVLDRQWTIGVNGVGTANLLDLTDNTIVPPILYAPILSPTFTGVVTATHIRTPLQTLTASGTSQTIDFNLGSIINLNLASASGTVALTLSNPQAATSYLIKVTQGATPRNLTFPVGTLQGGGGGVTYSSVANYKDLISILWDGSNYFISTSYNFS